MLTQILEDFKSNHISSRQLIYKIKGKPDLEFEVEKLTPFLDRQTDDIVERIYCLANNITDIIRCPYCGKKAKWSGRFKEGYKATCCSKECESHRVSDRVKETDQQKVAAGNRKNRFIQWQAGLSSVDDAIIKENIRYDNQLELITNPVLLEYLDNRFPDSTSHWETLHRIKLGIEEKPKCPVCGKPVVFVGRRKRVFSLYCSSVCGGLSEETTAKKQKTLIENWGTTEYYHSEKYRKHNFETYGAEYTWQREDVKKKRQDTCIAKFGTDKPSSLPEIQAKVRATNMERYGVENILLTEKCQEMKHEALRENSKAGSSEQENQIAEWLTELGFKYERHARSKEFPYNVDFYLIDYDLYLEYHGSQYHNKRAYLGTPEDIKEVQELKEKDLKRVNATGKTSQYAATIDTWTKYDVNKRNYAETHGYNYLEIYDCPQKQDLLFQLSFYLKCKDKISPLAISDSGLLNDFDKCLHLDGSLDGSSATFCGYDIVKHFQGNVWYSHEMELFANNITVRRKLIQNRMKYLDKKEHELTAYDLLSGFKKSGIYYGYSHFNPEWTNWFINKFNIKTVYDPCGGWGHHFLGMLSCAKIIYNEINPAVTENVQRMKDYFGINNLEIHTGDGTEYIPEEVDAFFMCPPYYNLEKYGNDFSSIEEYRAFLNKIFEIWDKNTAKIFGVVLREDYVNLIDRKYSEKYELSVKTSHLVKTKKKFKEYFYVFKK